LRGFVWTLDGRIGGWGARWVLMELGMVGWATMYSVDERWYILAQPLAMLDYYYCLYCIFHGHVFAGSMAAVIVPMPSRIITASVSMTKSTAIMMGMLSPS